MLSTPASLPPSVRQELIDGLFQAIDARQFEQLADYFAEDCRYERPGYLAIDGLAALVHFYEAERIIADGRHHIEGWLEQGDLAMAWGSFRGILRSGQLAEVEFADAYRFENGRIWRRKSYFFVPAV